MTSHSFPRWANKNNHLVCFSVTQIHSLFTAWLCWGFFCESMKYCFIHHYRSPRCCYALVSLATRMHCISLLTRSKTNRLELPLLSRKPLSLIFMQSFVFCRISWLFLLLLVCVALSHPAFFIITMYQLMTFFYVFIYLQQVIFRINVSL